MRKGSSSYFASGINYAGYATPQDMIVLENPVGSGLILRVACFKLLIASTAAALAAVHFVRRSALNSGGTSATVTPAKANSGQAAGVGVARTYSVVASSPGAAEATVAISRTATTVLASAGGEFKLITNPDLSPIMIRPGQCLAANFAGVAIPAGFNVQSWEIGWTQKELGA